MGRGIKLKEQKRGACAVLGCHRHGAGDPCALLLGLFDATMSCFSEDRQADYGLCFVGKVDLDIRSQSRECHDTNYSLSREDVEDGFEE